MFVFAEIVSLYLFCALLFHFKPQRPLNDQKIVFYFSDSLRGSLARSFTSNNLMFLSVCNTVHARKRHKIDLKLCMNETESIEFPGKIKNKKDTLFHTTHFI